MLAKLRASLLRRQCREASAIPNDFMANGKTAVIVLFDEVEMSNIARRQFLQRLFALPLLGSVIIPLTANSPDDKSKDRLLLVNGWVVLESDLR